MVNPKKGMEEGEFTEAREDLAALENEYEKIGFGYDVPPAIEYRQRMERRRLESQRYTRQRRRELGRRYGFYNRDRNFYSYVKSRYLSNKQAK